jgi:hypothetical protein
MHVRTYVLCVYVCIYYVYTYVCMLFVFRCVIASVYSVTTAEVRRRADFVNHYLRNPPHVVLKIGEPEVVTRRSVYNPFTQAL